MTTTKNSNTWEEEDAAALEEVRKLFPELSEEEVIEANKSLNRYAALIARMEARERE